MKSINAVLLTTVLFLASVIVISASLYQQKQTPNQADSEALVKLVLNDHVKMMLMGNENSTKNGIILLSTPSLRGLNIPSVVQGVSVRVLTQNKIDELSRVKPLNYVVFERVEKSHAYVGEAEVEVTFFWGYEVDAKEQSFGLNSGGTYFCSKSSVEWAISGGEFWIP